MEGIPKTESKTIESVSSAEKQLREKFEEQFDNFETIPFGNGVFEAIDISPDIISKETPILLVPGFGKSPRSYKEVFFELYKSGRRILSLTAPTSDIDEEGSLDVPKAQSDRARAVLELIQIKGIEKVDVVGHSEGGMNAVIAAEYEPDRFQHFVFVALPGVTDTQSYFEIAKRGIQNQVYTKQQKKIAGDDVRGRFEQSEEDIKQWVKERGGLKATIESMNPGKVDITEYVQKLHQTGHGISIISGVEDKMLPMEEYQRTKEGEKRSVEDLGVDGFYSVKKGHGELEVNGEMGFLVSHAIDTLGKKYQKSNDPQK